MKKTRKWIVFAGFFVPLLAFSPAFSAVEEFPSESYQHYLKYLLYQRTDRADKALAELVLAYQANPEAYHLLRPIVNMALDLQMAEIAQIYAQRAMEMDPENSESLLMGAQVLEAEEKTAEALELLEKAHKADPANTAVILEMAALYAETGRRREASRYMDLYLKAVPGSIELLKLKASFELQDKNPKAMESYRKAFESAPDDSEALDGLIGAYRAFSTSRELLQLLSKMREQDPENFLLAVKICQIQETQPDRRACFEKLLEERPGFSSGLLGLLETYEQEERWEEALEILREHKESMGREAALGLKESFYLLRMGRDEEALGVLEEESKLHPDNDNVAYFLALGYQDLGRWKEAKNQLERIYQRYPHWKEAAYNYALAAGELGDAAMMERVLAALSREYPEDAVILNAMAYTWAEQGKELDQAKALVEKALSQEPENPSYLDSLGWILFKMGDKKGAQEVLESVSKKVRDPEILIHLSYLMAAQERGRAAWEIYLAAYFELAGKKVPSLRLRAQLDQLRKRLPRKARPSTGDIFKKGIFLTENPVAYHCDFEVSRTPPFRARLMLRRGQSDEDSPLRALVQFPGEWTPITLEELAHHYPEAAPFILDTDSALENFFIAKSWAEGASSWKLREDFSARYAGPKSGLVLSDFYTSGSEQLLPRLLKIEGTAFKGECRSHD